MSVFVFFRFHQVAQVGLILQFRPRLTLQSTDSLPKVWLEEKKARSWQLGLDNNFKITLVIWGCCYFFYAIGQSDTDSSDSTLTQESHPVGRTEPGAIVTPHLLLAVCGLLDNLLAVLPEFSLSALKQNQILENMARLERHAKTNRCFAKFCHYLYFLKHHTKILLVNDWIFITIF